MKDRMLLIGAGLVVLLGSRVACTELKTAELRGQLREALVQLVEDSTAFADRLATAATERAVRDSQLAEIALERDGLAATARRQRVARQHATARADSLARELAAAGDDDAAAIIGELEDQHALEIASCERTIDACDQQRELLTKQVAAEQALTAEAIEQRDDALRRFSQAVEAGAAPASGLDLASIGLGAGIGAGLAFIVALIAR